MRTAVPARLSAIAKRADVRFNGDHSWDLHVHNDALYCALLS